MPDTRTRVWHKGRNGGGMLCDIDGGAPPIGNTVRRRDRRSKSTKAALFGSCNGQGVQGDHRPTTARGDFFAQHKSPRRLDCRQPTFNSSTYISTVASSLRRCQKAASSADRGVVRSSRLRVVSLCCVKKGRLNQEQEGKGSRKRGCWVM